MTSIEKIARAMSAHAEARDAGFQPFDESPQYIRDQWHELARAAVEALREPSDTVIEPIKGTIFLDDLYEERKAAEAAWSAAIDAILKE